MGRKYVLVDDLDGKELPEDTAPINLSYGNKRYALYLSDENHGKLLEALKPFIDDAEVVFEGTTRKASAKAANDADKERTKAARVWARETGYRYKGADGEERTLGDRGAVPSVVMQAWEEAGEPGL